MRCFPRGFQSFFLVSRLGLKLGLIPSLRLLMEDRLTAARDELLSLVRGPLPCAVPGSGPWQALALRRDIQALRAEAPPHGLSSLSNDLNSYQHFDRTIQLALATLDKRAGETAGNLPFNALYGPWEGGVASETLTSPGVADNPLSVFKVVSWNLRGSLSAASRQEAHGGHILQLVTTLHSLQASLAVISDPCFGPGMRWPRWSGYEFFGHRSTLHDTVAILIAIELVHNVEILPDVGDKRAIWLHVHASGQAGAGLLVLAMYAPPSNYSPKERLDFFISRVTELHAIRAKPEFASIPVLLAGDLNVHVRELCSKNSELERPVDRDIVNLLAGPVGFNLVLRNPFCQPTHDSGSAIDLVYSSQCLTPRVQILPKEASLLGSDHRILLITELGSISLRQKNQVGKTKWAPFSEAWGDAFSSIPRCLSFICFWTQLLLHDTFIRDSLITGKWHKLRQALVDKVVWWRSVVICLVGHLRGLAVTVKPTSTTFRPEESSLDKFLLEWYGPQCQGDAIQYEEFLSNLGQAGSPAIVRKFLDCHASDPGKAQAILSMMINPKVSTDICLIDGVSGDRASETTVVQLLAQDILNRPQEAHPGDSFFTEAVHETLRAERLKAESEAAQEPHMFFTLTEVKQWIQSVSLRKASVRFPRAVIRNEHPQGHELCWLLLNLFLAFGVVPTAWMREVNFIRKRGPQLVTDLKNLRPISYTDELQTLFDLAWLQRCRHLLEAYVGPEQAGGRFDSTLVSLGILVALQARRNWSLPTYCLKADLLQGYDLAWKAAMLLHTRWAGVTGSLWLCLDSAIQQDSFRVRYGPLVGPAMLLLVAGLGQGGRRAVHLFGALARGIPDHVMQKTIGVSIGGVASASVPFTGT